MLCIVADQEQQLDTTYLAVVKIKITITNEISFKWI